MSEAIERAVRAAHTPGPWCVHEPTGFETLPGRQIKVDDRVETPVAVALMGLGASEDGKAEQLANARLIAAAPDLLAVCEAMYENQRNEPGFMQSTTAIKARAAITKAGGEA